MKVALVGTANAGKTTLVKALGKVYKGHYLLLDVTKDFTQESRSHLATQHEIQGHLIKKEGEHKKFISDRSVIDNMAYFMYKYRGLNKPTNAVLYSKQVIGFDAYMRMKPYDALVFVAEYFPLENNGIREQDEKMQKDVYALLSSMVPEYSYIYKIPYIKVVGSTDERVYLLEKALKKYYVQKKMSDFE